MTQEISLEKILVHKTSIEVRTAGRGPDLVYFHAGDGLAKSASLIRHLANNFRVIAPSPPGFDSSGPLDGYRTVDDLSYLMLDLLDRLAVRGAIVVGVSFGAWLAAEIAVKTVERISGIVFINPVGIKCGRADSQDIADIFYQTHRDVRRLLYSDAQSDDSDYSAMTAEEVGAAVRNRESLTWFGWSPLLNNPSLRSRLHRVRVPTLVLRGTNDRVVTESYSRSYTEAIPNARIEPVADGGHYMHDELPETLATRIALFARQVQGQPEKQDHRGPRNL